MAGIPAASIAGVDIEAIARRGSAAAREIARLGERLRLGEETAEEFLALVRLLYDGGEATEAEYLLRRNLALGTDAHSLYLRLFGHTKEESFREAICGFELQFGVALRPTERSQFLVEGYHTRPGTSVGEAFSLLSRPCQVRFDYAERDSIHADIVLLDPNREVFEPHECLLLLWADGVWQVVGPLSADRPRD